MRFNKASFATISGTTIALIAAVSITAPANADSVSKVDFKSAKSKSQVEAKQIAVSIPGLGEAKIIVTPKTKLRANQTASQKMVARLLLSP